VKIAVLKLQNKSAGTLMGARVREHGIAAHFDAAR
jgi:hypothetical protein